MTNTNKYILVCLTTILLQNCRSVNGVSENENANLESTSSTTNKMVVETFCNEDRENPSTNPAKLSLKIQNKRKTTSSMNDNWPEIDPSKLEGNLSIRKNGTYVVDKEFKLKRNISPVRTDGSIDVEYTAPGFHLAVKTYPLGILTEAATLTATLTNGTAVPTAWQCMVSKAILKLKYDTNATR